MYTERINELFKNIPANVPESQPEDYKKKRQNLLTDILGKSYTK